MLSIVDGQYAPNPFEIVATVTNNGAIPATDVKVILYLPAGLSLASGSQTKSIGDLPVGHQAQVTWSVLAAGQKHPITLGYFATAVASNALATREERQITLPSGALTLNSIASNVGGDTGSVTATIHGGGLQEGAVAKLVRTGEPEVVGGNIAVADDGFSLSATFDLKGKARGAWNVAVTNPDGTSAMLSDAFTIEEGRAAEVWVDIIGSSTVRAGMPASFYVLYGNRGNVDIYGSVSWVAIPREVSWSLGSSLGHIVPFGLDYLGPIDWAHSPYYLEFGTKTLIPIVIPIISPTNGVTYQIKLKSGGSFELSSWTTPPMVVKSTTRLADWVKVLINDKEEEQAYRDYKDAWKEYWDAVGDGAPAEELERIKRERVVPNMESWTWGVFGRLVKAAVDGYFIGKELVMYGVNEFLKNELIEALKEKAMDCLNPECPQAIQTAINYLEDILCKRLTFECDSLMKRLIVPVEIVSSLDPNDKSGSVGIGEARYQTETVPLNYSIFFENVPTATAPAQEVVITDQLDMANMDLNTFSLGLITFGDRLITPPPGLSQYTTDVDLRPANNLIVRINAGLDKATGLATWRFISLDPATRLPTDDPLAGFLPPNKNSPEGQGSVLFSVKPKQGIATGTEIRNKARIVFDVNEPIDTPEWLNTLDNTAPTSHMLPLAAIQSPNFLIGWDGTDIGSGVASYTIYASQNGGPFTPVLSDTTETSAMFTGQPGSTYSFYSVARDQVGNMEQPHSIPDATTHSNVPPIANAGPDQTVRQGSLVTLNGAGSSDPDNGPSPLSFIWSKIAGPAVTLTGANASMATFTPSAAESYTFSLVVNDGQDNSEPVFVTITVPKLGDIDLDGDVDNNDLNFILAARNTSANGQNDLRDLNGDGKIDALDSRKLVTLCTNPRCATQ
jgi:hypothetical protein